MGRSLHARRVATKSKFSRVLNLVPMARSPNTRSDTARRLVGIHSPTSRQALPPFAGYAAVDPLAREKR
jgi:hypothetical protein